MNNKTAELLLVYQQLKEAQQRVRELEIELEKSEVKCVVEWIDDGGKRHRTVFECMDIAANFWKDIAAIYCPMLYKVFV